MEIYANLAELKKVINYGTIGNTRERLRQIQYFPIHSKEPNVSLQFATKYPWKKRNICIETSCTRHDIHYFVFLRRDIT